MSGIAPSIWRAWLNRDFDPDPDAGWTHQVDVLGDGPEPGTLGDQLASEGYPEAAGIAFANSSNDDELLVHPVTKYRWAKEAREGYAGTTACYGGAQRTLVAALMLYGQPFGFTWRDVERLEFAALTLREDGDADGERDLLNLARRIAALLPPESETES